MKTLIILSAVVLALASCNKELPVPDPNPFPDPVYTPDPDPDPDPDPAPDPGYDDPPPDCYNNHSGSTITWATATSLSQVG
jgi:hypothetical protein